MTEYLFSSTPCPLRRQKSWVDYLEKEASQASSPYRKTIFQHFSKGGVIIELMVDCRRLIMNQHTANYDSLQHKKLLNELYKKGDEFFKWYKEWMSDVAHLDPRSLTIGHDRITNGYSWHQDLMGLFQFVTLVYKRLYVGLGGDGSHSVEMDTQSLAMALRAIHEEQAGNPEFPVPFALRNTITATLKTADEWEDISRLQFQQELGGKGRLLHRKCFMAGWSWLG